MASEWTIEKARASRRAYYARNKEKVKTLTSAWAKRNPRSRRSSELKRNFGIDISIYEAMLAAQRGRCAICAGRQSRKSLSVDHCHKSRKIRALLCNGCNRAIGYLNDKPRKALGALRYLLVWDALLNQSTSSLKMLSTLGTNLPPSLLKDTLYCDLVILPWNGIKRKSSAVPDVGAS